MQTSKSHLLPWPSRFMAHVVLLLAALFIAPLVLAEQKNLADEDPHLSDAERTELVSMLEESRRNLLSRIASLSDKAFHFKAAADRWSIAEILEHLLLTEGLFQGHIEKAMASGANPAWARETAGRDDQLFRFVPLRNRRFDAPTAATPEGKMSRRDLLRTYEEARNKTLAVANSDAPIKAHTADNGLLGPMNVHQWALFTALHNLRHNQQIVEVMATAEFPHG